MFTWFAFAYAYAFDLVLFLDGMSRDKSWQWDISICMPCLGLPVKMIDHWFGR